MTLSCAESENVQFIAQTTLARNMFSRMNSVQERLCEVYDRINVVHFEILKYCQDVDISEASSSSSSSSNCFNVCACDCESRTTDSYLIIDDDWDDDMVELLVTLEQDTCDMIRLLKELESEADENCIPSSSSSEEPSSSSSEPSSSSSIESSSSSLPESSSSSLPESSSSSLPSLPFTIQISSECEDLGILEPLILFLIPGIDVYVIEAEYQEWSSSESSSSSSLSYSGPGMASGFSIIFGIDNTWLIYFDGVLVGEYLGSDPFSPYGSYLVTAEGNNCIGEYIIVE